MTEASRAIEADLRALGTPERAENEARYLKSDLEHIGVKVPLIRKVVRARLSELAPDRPALLALVEALWARPVHELRFAAVVALARSKKLLVAEDLALVERLLREARTWALVDPLSTDVAGSIAERFDVGVALDRWSADEDFWVRRASMLTLLRPLRSGAGEWERFTRYADSMLEEKEFFIRKAIGWVLRDVGRKRPVLVEEFISVRTHRASGVTMREAVKVLPEARREALMQAYREKR